MDSKMSDDKVNLTNFSKFSGCGAKLGPGLLDKVLCGLSQPSYPNLITDFTTSDDAGIYKISDDLALVQTLDFFPPIVDDPYTFGEIAAANALSDVFAMGGKAITAMSIVAFPKESLDIMHLRAIMDGGLSKLVEAGAALVGGHSVEDDELKFGFAVTGTVHPDKVLTNCGLNQGETLILTKKLGSGTINTALRAGIASKESVDASTEVMRELNMKAAQVITQYNVSACTDVTGFGLLGHACEMISNSNCGLEINYGAVPQLPDVESYIAMGLVPAGTYRNRDYRQKFISNRDELKAETLDLLFDPQTSGGLMFSVKNSEASEVLKKLEDEGVVASAIGKTTDKSETIEVVE
jgi:selenide,water dikinase